MRALRWIPLLALLVTVAACEDDDNGTDPEPALSFRATLTGAKEKPNAVNPAGTGTATFTLDAAETTLTYSINVTGMTSTISAAHIHLGNANVAGGVIVALTTPTNNGTVTGTITNATALNLGLSFRSLIALIRNGDAYVNVHTTTNPGSPVKLCTSAPFGFSQIGFATR